MSLVHLALLVLVAAGSLAPYAAGGTQPDTAERPLRWLASLPALKSDDVAASGEVQIALDSLGVSMEGMIGQARTGMAVDGGADSGMSRSAKGTSRGQPKPRPSIDKAYQDKLHQEFLSKPEDVVQRNIKSQRAGSVAAKIAAASLTRTPPDDYYMCAQVYMAALGERTPLIHSLCTWWSQTKESAPEAEPPVQSRASTSVGLLCRQIRKPRQCFRFDGDAFLKHPRLNDFTKHCSLDCLGKTTAGSREGVGGL